MKKADPIEPVNKGMLDEAVEAIVKGIEVMFSNQKKHFNRLEAGHKD